MTQDTGDWRPGPPIRAFAPRPGAVAPRGIGVPAPGATREQKADDPTRPANWEIAALAFQIIVVLLVDEFIGPPAHDALNIFAPVWLMIVLLLGALRMIRIDPRATLSSLLWFRLATATYFGFGSIVPLLLNPISRLVMASFYDARTDELLKLNLVVAVSTFLVLGAALLVCALFPRQSAEQTRHRPHARLFYGLLFAGVGYTVKLLVEVPLNFGAFGSAIKPGLFLQIAQISSVGLYLLAFHAFREAKSLLPLVYALLIFDLFVGALMFSKFSILLPLIMFLLGWLSSSISVWRIAFAAGLFISAYTLSQPLIEFGRTSLEQKYASIAEGGLNERIEIIKQFGDREEGGAFNEDAQSSWMRLSYVNAGCFAISRYDGGAPGPSLDFAFATLAPRFLWRDKPIITDIGIVFNVMATGSARSASAPGYFADAYWAGGWEGVLLVMPVIGVVFALYSRFSINVFARGRWLFFPLVLLAMKMGLRVDGALVSDFLGASVTWAWAYIGARLLEPRIDALTEIFARPEDAPTR